MPDFTNLLNRYQQIHNEPVDDESIEEELETEEAGNLIPNNLFKQWYESDPERLELERQAFAQRGFTTAKLNDSRICFISEKPADHNLTIIIICDWLYPLQPPIVFTEGNDEITALILKNEDNSLNLLTDFNSWQSEMSAVTMLDYFLEQVEIFKKPQHEKVLE